MPRKKSKIPFSVDGTGPEDVDIDLGKDGYFFLYNEEGSLLADPNMEGQNVWNIAIADGFFMAREANFLL